MIHDTLISIMTKVDPRNLMVAIFFQKNLRFPKSKEKIVFKDDWWAMTHGPYDSQEKVFLWIFVLFLKVFTRSFSNCSQSYLQCKFYWPNIFWL